MPMAEKLARADIVIRNEGSREEIRRQVCEVWRVLQERERRRRTEGRESAPGRKKMLE